MGNLQNDTTWKTELEPFTDWLAAAGRPPSTIYLRTYHLRRLWADTGKAPYDVDLDDLITHLARPSWSANTRRSVRSSVRAFYHWAFLTGRMPSDPSTLIPSVTTTPGKPRPASDAAVNAGLVTADPRVRLMVRIGAHAGLRCCEIARVHTADVFEDLVGYSLRVLGKGGKTRIVPLSNELAEEILSHPAGYLFPPQKAGRGVQNEHISPAHVSKLISRALPPGVTAHQMRHRFASRAFRGSGYNLRAVQELLGHASIATTQIYTAVDDDDLRRAAMSAA